ncbi:hypothetical protein T4A_1296 [Trichinella pseudospiralis]|uniref:Uncharacterized protein n=1 Tax=Trichinella pseudospiralis TaxID=6337 RepID=A0A0V1F0A2_TRIPS|nr:hypothetical protein T4A_1296 [Trichinella pseudospiralis]
MSSRQPVSDETLTSSKGEDRDISNVASETDDSVYDCKISCASLMGQFEPEDKSRKYHVITFIKENYRLNHSYHC